MRSRVAVGFLVKLLRQDDVCHLVTHQRCVSVLTSFIDDVIELIQQSSLFLLEDVK